MRRILKKIFYITFFIFLSLYASYFLEAILEILDFYKYKEILGFTGVSLIFLSFIYSIVKRTDRVKNKLFFLKLHIALAIAGTIIIFTHANFNHQFIFPILTYIFIFLAYSSGFVGNFLVREVKRQMLAESKKDGPPLYPLVVLNKAVFMWRTFHIPVVSYLFIFLVIHVTSTLYYYGIRF